MTHQRQILGKRARSEGPTPSAEPISSDTDLPHSCMNRTPIRRYPRYIHWEDVLVDRNEYLPPLIESIRMLVEYGRKHECSRADRTGLQDDINGTKDAAVVAKQDIEEHGDVNKKMKLQHIICDIDVEPPKLSGKPEPVEPPIYLPHSKPCRVDWSVTLARLHNISELSRSSIPHIGEQHVSDASGSTPLTATSKSGEGEIKRREKDEKRDENLQVVAQEP